MRSSSGVFRHCRCGRGPARGPGPSARPAAPSLPILRAGAAPFQLNDLPLVRAPWGGVAEGQEIATGTNGGEGSPAFAIPSHLAHPARRATRSTRADMLSCPDPSDWIASKAASSRICCSRKRCRASCCSGSWERRRGVRRVKRLGAGLRWAEPCMRPRRNELWPGSHTCRPAALQTGAPSGARRGVRLGSR